MAAAGLWSNPTELATILIEVQKALKGSSSIFKKETIEEMLIPQKEANHIGIGFFLEGKGDSTIFKHNGWNEGFVGVFKMYKTLGKGVVIMVNSNEGIPLIDEVMNSVAIKYKWPGYIPTGAQYKGISSEESRQLRGVYTASEGYDIKIESAGNSLLFFYQNQEPIPLLKTTEGKFKNETFNFTITFDKDKIELNQLGRSKAYQKKRN